MYYWFLMEEKKNSTPPRSVPIRYVTVAFLTVLIQCHGSVFAAPTASMQAESILQKAGFSGRGLIVVLDCNEGELTAGLGKASSSMVQGLDTNPEQV